MGRTILVTGASGALGPHLVSELLRCNENEHVFALLRPGPAWASRVDHLQSVIAEMTADIACPRDVDGRLHFVPADICRHDLGLDTHNRTRLSTDVDIVIHAAANTRFAAPMSELRDVNVEGTRHVLEFARRCAQLRQLIVVSTACVAGTKTGAIAECLDATPPQFLNPYEQTKWEAERLTMAAGLPTRIARLSTCIGGERTGYVHRFGAIHQSIRWLIRGLVPMLPAVDGSRVDLIATDVAARWIARAATRPLEGVEVYHVAAGDRAIPIQELVAATVSYLRDTVSEWRNRQREPPVIVDAATFDLFEQCIRRSGDGLFGRVLEAAGSFFPALLHPKIYQTTRAEHLWGGPLPLSDWRMTVGRVIDFGCARNWRCRRHLSEHAHV